MTAGWSDMADRFDAAALAMGGGPLDGVSVSGATALSLDAHARLVGSYQWVEHRLFEILGSWVASEPVPEAQMVFDVFSQQHAWHAELCSRTGSPRSIPSTPKP